MKKNLGEAVWNTCFGIPNKTNDNVKARLDQAEICSRPSLKLVRKRMGSGISQELHSALRTNVTRLPSFNGLSSGTKVTRYINNTNG